MPGLILKSVFALIGCLVAADVAGVVASTILDVLGLRGDSPAVPYAIWLVFGAFCGLFAYNLAGRWASPKAEPGAPDWSARPGAKRIGTGILLTELIVVAVVTALCTIVWGHSGAGDYYVPDSEPHSIVFLVAVVGAIIAARLALMPTPDLPVSGGEVPPNLP